MAWIQLPWASKSRALKGFFKEDVDPTIQKKINKQTYIYIYIYMYVCCVVGYLDKKIKTNKSINRYIHICTLRSWVLGPSDLEWGQ